MGRSIRPTCSPRISCRSTRAVSTTELNNTFYRLPTAKAVDAWCNATPDDFLFAWKASRLITHLKRLKDVEENIAFVFGRMAGLGSKFGPVLFQLPPSLKADPERQGEARPMSRPSAEGPPLHFRIPAPELVRGADLRSLARSRCGAVLLRPRGRAGPLGGHGEFRLHPGARHGRALLRQLWQEDPDGLGRSITQWREDGRSVYVYFDNDIKSAAPADAKMLVALTS